MDERNAPSASRALPNAATASLISLQGVTVTIGGYDALRDVSVSFQEGKSTVITGPSGCGKSTLLKVAAGLIPPDAGKVLHRGQDMFWFSERRMRDLRKSNGFGFQDGALWENKTIFENLALPLQVHFPELPRPELERRVVRMLERGGLADAVAQRPAQLSGGEKKIVSFLRAVIAEPALVFLDEPTLSIDHEMAETISRMIRDLKARGCSIVAVTHDPRLTSTLADWLVVLEAGRVLEAGEFDAMKKTANPRVRAILAQILGEIASFDTELLELLDAEREGAPPGSLSSKEPQRP